MKKDTCKKSAINHNLKKMIRCSLLICCVIGVLLETTVFAYQKTEINPFGLTFSLSDDFVIYKNVNYIDNNYIEELGNDDLYFYAESERKNISIQIWKGGESEYTTINNLNDNQISEIMKDIDILGIAEDLMIESSIKTALQTYNGQKYYMVRGFFNEAPDVFCEYAVTINNGYIVWYQIFHYDTYSQTNTNEILDSFEFTENESYFSNTIKLKNKKNEMRSDAFAKGVIEYIFYALILGCFVLVKKLWRKLVNKKNASDKVDVENTSLQSDSGLENEKEVARVGDEQKNECKEYEICIFDTETRTLRKEIRKIDTIKFPPLKYSVNDTYYAIEKIKDGKKVRVYYEKNNWDKKIEICLQINE